MRVSRRLRSPRDPRRGDRVRDGAIVRPRRAWLLLLGELSSATLGSLTIALRAAASELRGHGVCWCRPARAWASTDGLFKHRCLSWRSDAVAQRPVAPVGLPARVDFWSAGRMQRCRARDETDAGSPHRQSQATGSECRSSAVALAYSRRLDGSVRGCPVGKVPRSRLGTRTYRKGGWR